MSVEKDDGPKSKDDEEQDTDMLEIHPSSISNPGISTESEENASNINYPSELERTTLEKVPSHPNYHWLANDILSTYLDNYFYYANTWLWIFPTNLFLKWISDSSTKSDIDLALVRGLLAVGSLYSNFRDSQNHGIELITLSVSVINTKEVKHLDLKSIQVCIIAVLYYLKTGEYGRARELSDLVLGEIYDTELFAETPASDTSHEAGLYNFSRDSFLECRRRTFWAAYVLGTFDTTRPPTKSFSEHRPLSVRLPCHEDLYERSIIPETSFLAVSKPTYGLHRSGKHANTGSMAYFVKLVDMWNEIHTRIYQQPNQHSVKEIVDFWNDHHHLTQHLQRWKEDYHSYTNSLGSHASSPRPADQAGMTTSLHLIYHFAIMRLNRYILQSHRREGQIRSHIRTVHNHAFEILKIAQRVYEQTSQEHERAKFFMSTHPLASLAVMSAVDIFTSTGLLRDLLDSESRLVSLVAAGLAVTEELAKHWPSGQSQCQSIAKRYQNLLAVGLTSTQGKQAFWFRNPLEHSLGKEKDIMYLTQRKQVMLALGFDVQQSPDHMFIEINDGNDSPVAISNLVS